MAQGRATDGEEGGTPDGLDNKMAPRGMKELVRPKKGAARVVTKKVRTEHKARRKRK